MTARRSRARANGSTSGSHILDNFKAWDQDGDGRLNELEFVSVFADLGMDAEKISSLFRNADGNKDGKVDYAEFVAWIFGAAPIDVRGNATASTVQRTVSNPLRRSVLGVPAAQLEDGAVPAAEAVAAAEAAPGCDAGTPAVGFFLGAAPASVYSEPLRRFRGVNGVDVAAAVAVAEVHEKLRVALPLEMGQYSKRVVISDAQYRLYFQDFTTVDTNGSGWIERDDVEALLALQLGREPTNEQVEQFLNRFDFNSDGTISLWEWIRATIGKHFSVSSLAASSMPLDDKPPEYKDCNGEPLAIGMIYAFTGGGCTGGAVCRYEGTSGRLGCLAEKSMLCVDCVGEFSGLNITINNGQSLKRSSEKEAWMSAQQSAVRMLKHFEKKLADGDASVEKRIETTREVIEGYSAFTQTNPLATPVAPPPSAVVPPSSAVAAQDLDSEVAVAVSEVRERERVALPMQMEAFSKKVVLSDAQYRVYQKDFEEKDIDGSGRIETSEIAALLRSQLATEPTPEQLEAFLRKFDTNHDGFITLDEWIGGIVGKEFQVSTAVLAKGDDVPEGGSPNGIDADGNPMAMGFIYVFTGGGCCGGDVCQFQGTSGSQFRLAGKSTHNVDGVGEFTGMTIVTTNSSKLRRATEKDAWEAGQKSCVRMYDYYKNKAAEGDEQAASRIEKQIQVIEGYAEFTGVRGLDER